MIDIKKALFITSVEILLFSGGCVSQDKGIKIIDITDIGDQIGLCEKLTGAE